ncbi:ABC transporter ATP-binding protein [Agromyces marinus]|nr:ATP-binding cassette domain-containing protein [Agromyces marinus]UIP57196.1 Lipoprotein-releasing system ATP-binding protein LolD [Agromyces marinus]
MTAILTADELSFRYDPHTPLVERWSARFDAGEVVAVTGPSGRGKSTLLYLLGLMLKPRGGQVLLDGAPVHSLSDARRAALRAGDFGFVFQDAALDPSRTVLDNILETVMYRGGDRSGATRRAEELMEQFGVGLRRTAKPGQVSGGQAQRIAICRALLGRPRVLLADEPTGNLDPASSDIVVGALHEHAREGGTAIVVTHDPALVARCDRRIEL